MHVGLAVEREAAVARLASATSTQAQNLALTELAAISKAAAVSQEQLALAEKAATTATNAHTTALNALDVAAHKARFSMISLGNVMNVMMAAWIGWEIGTFLSNQFEGIRIAGVYMVHGLMKGWDLASEAYERFAATINPFGDEEKQQAKLQAIAAEYAARKELRAFQLKETLADTPDDKQTKKGGYTNDQKAMANGAAEEAQRRKEEATRAAAAATKEADDAYQKYTSTMDGFNKQIRDTNPYLDEHENKLTEIDLAVQKAIAVTPKYEKTLRAAGEAIKANIVLAKQMKDGISEPSEFFKRYLEEVENQPPQHNEAGAMNIRWEEELKMLQSLQPSAAADALNEQIATFERLLSDIPEQAGAVTAAIAKLKADFSASSGLDALLSGNLDLQDSIAVDKASPWEKETLDAEKSYTRQMEIEKKKLQELEKGSDLRAAQIERIGRLEEKHTLWAQKNEEERWKSNAYAAADAMGQIGSVLMEGNRDQFEAGKAMMMGQAIIAAALAIVQCYAQLGPIGGTIAAVGVGIATLAQISAIEATEYQPRALGGPVVAGGSYLVGEQGPELIRMGSAGTVIPNNALAMAGEAQLKATKENTKAIATLSEGFHSVADSMSDIVLQATNGGLVSNRLAGMSLDAEAKETLFSKAMNVAGALFKTFNALIDGDLKGAIQGVANYFTFGLASLGGGLFRGKQSVTGAGLQLEYSGRDVSALQYTDIKKSGGMFHSDKSWTEFSEVDAALVEAFNGIAENIAGSINTAGAALGGLAVNLDQVRISSKLDLRGMDEDQASQAIEDWFSKLAALMTDNLGGPEAQAALESATRFGETSYEALMRVTMSLQTLNEAALQTGNALLEASIASGDLASSVVDAFGGIDKFFTSIDKYNKVVNSEDEYTAIKLAAAHREIAAALADQVYTIPKTVAEYKALVEATDMTSPLYQSLIELADSFGVIADAAEESRDQILSASMDTLSRTMDIAQGLLGKIRDMQLNDSTVSPEMQYRTASNLFSDAAMRAFSGDQEAAASIPALAQQFIDASKDYNASGVAFQSDYQTVMETMSKLVGATGIPTVSESQRLLDKLDELASAISDNDMAQAARIGEAITAGLGLAGTNLAYGIADPLAPLQTMDDLRALLSGDQSSPLTVFSGALGSGTAGTATENLSNIRNNTTTMIDALNSILEINGAAAIAGGSQVHTRSQSWATEGIGAVNSAVSTWQANLTSWPTHGDPLGPRATAATAQYDINGDGYITEQDRTELSKMLTGYRPLPEYASGGNYPGGGAIMGEFGPEFVDSAPGHVYRADETRALFAMATRGASVKDENPGSSEVVKELKEQNRILLGLLVEAKANNRLGQAGFKQLINLSEEANQNTREQTSTARRAAAR